VGICSHLFWYLSSLAQSIEMAHYHAVLPLEHVGVSVWKSGLMTGKKP